MNIQVLQNKFIDKKKWDEVLISSPHALIYANSWYLDVVCPDWKGMVVGDYEVVMPLPYTIKYGIPCYLQPPFLQQFDAFSKSAISTPVLQEITTRIFRWPMLICDIQTHTALPNPFWLREHKRYNIELNLNIPYSTLNENYNSNTLRNIKNARKNGIHIQTSEDDEVILTTFQKTKNIPMPYSMFKKLLIVVKKSAKVHIFHARDVEGAFLAGAILFEYANRLYYIFSGTSEDARNTGASHLLIDYVIQRYSEKNCIFDFEGSDHESLALFYLGFGAQKTTYYRYQSRFKP